MYVSFQISYMQMISVIMSNCEINGSGFPTPESSVFVGIFWIQSPSK
jgi:hypothetical protein